jgi:hypothetical protein
MDSILAGPHMPHIVHSPGDVDRFSASFGKGSTVRFAWMHASHILDGTLPMSISGPLTNLFYTRHSQVSEASVPFIPGQLLGFCHIYSFDRVCSDHRRKYVQLVISSSAAH